MTTSVRDLQERSFGATLRRDAWWIAPALTALVLGSFGVYATWAAWVNRYYEWGPYLSPFYSPLIQTTWWPLSPAFLILIFPGAFRATCYYYRKAYYRAFFLDPPACAVSEPARHDYRGETAFPFILQNVHRYFFYLAVLFIAFLWHDAIRSFFFDGHFGIGVGTLVLTINVTLLSLYTFSCHSLRHLAGGKVDCFSCATFGRSRFEAWSSFSFLNEHHMLFAWCSLVSVGFADFYVRMIASGAFRDLRLL